MKLQIRTSFPRSNLRALIERLYHQATISVRQYLARVIFQGSRRTPPRKSTTAYENNSYRTVVSYSYVHHCSIGNSPNTIHAGRPETVGGRLLSLAKREVSGVVE